MARYTRVYSGPGLTRRKFSGTSRPAGTQTLSMSLTGDAELKASVEDMLKNTKDLTYAWDRFYRPAFNEAMAQTFAGQQDGSWRQHNRRYARWLGGKGGGVMQLSGDLKRSLAGKTTESYFEALPTYMKIGSEPVAKGRWTSPNTPKGRMVIYAQSSYMSREMIRAGREHLEWYTKKWGRNV